MPRADIARRAAHGVGELLLTIGLIIGLYTIYELYGTSLSTHNAQQGASAELQRSWSVPGAPEATPTVGQPLARISIPALGADWSYVLLEGTDQSVLAHGPGHYSGTPLPGQPGNVAIAGHRVGHGAPFDGLGNIQSCDAINVETRDAWLTYRVLPMPGEAATWAQTTAATPDCNGVAPLPAPYEKVTGREVVLPTQTEVIAPVPDDPALSPEHPENLLTLTTCNPRFSARQRLIIHAVLTASTPKTPTPGTEP